MNQPTVALSGARLTFGDRVLWDHLDLSVSPGEFIAVLGPNGTGKTSLLKVLLGQLPLSAGVSRVSGPIGYVPQHHPIDREVMLRGRDLVALGVDGHRWGALPLRASDRARRREAVQRALQQVNAEQLADIRVGLMSGGELQRVRIAQALASEPTLMLCDEPLLALDPANAKLVATLIDRRRRDAGTTVIVVTHEINPILPYVDRVLYLVDGRFRIGAPEQVMTSATLSELYRADIEVVQVKDRYFVVGTEAIASAAEAIASAAQPGAAGRLADGAEAIASAAEAIASAAQPGAAGRLNQGEPGAAGRLNQGEPGAAGRLNQNSADGHF